MSVLEQFASTGQEKPARCDHHGEYVSRNLMANIWTKCPECTRAQREEDEKERAKIKAENDAWKWQQKLKRAAIPERFMDRTLPSYQAETEAQKNALQFAIDFAAQFEGKPTGRGAIFSGERGTGKTHLAVGIALRIMGKFGKTAVFTTVQRYIRSVRDTWSRDSDYSESEVVAMYAQPDLLILDEVGVQAGSENEKQILFDLINERYEARKSTLLLTNLTIEECQAFLGERIFDRMREDGGKFVAFDWESWRKRNG